MISGSLAAVSRSRCGVPYPVYASSGGKCATQVPGDWVPMIQRCLDFARHDVFLGEGWDKSEATGYRHLRCRWAMTVRSCGHRPYGTGVHHAPNHASSRAGATSAAKRLLLLSSRAGAASGARRRRVEGSLGLPSPYSPGLFSKKPSPRVSHVILSDAMGSLAQRSESIDSVRVRLRREMLRLRPQHDGSLDRAWKTASSL